MVSRCSEVLRVHLNGQVLKKYADKLRSVVGEEILWNEVRKDPVIQESFRYGSCGSLPHWNCAYKLRKAVGITRTDTIPFFEFRNEPSRSILTNSKGPARVRRP